MYKKRNEFWKKQGINGPTSLPFLGTLHRLFFSPGCEIDLNDFKKYGNVYGFFEGNTPKLMINDAELIKRINVKDAHIFVDRTHEKIPLNAVLEKLLTLLKGDEWKKVRKMLTPSFTSGKLRKMYPLMCQSANSFMEVMNEAAENKTDVDLKELWGCYTLDVIAKCCFAIDVNSYKDPNNIFVQKVAEINQFRILPVLAYFLIPEAIYKLLGLQKRNFKIFDYFVDLVNHVIDEREKSKTEHSDFLQMVLEAVKNDKDFVNETNNSYDRDMVIAQSILFLLAGYETTALLLTFCSYVLATEPHIQEQLYDEISAIPSKEGILDHEALMSAPYLNAFILETLRFYPPAIRFERVSNEEYTIAEYDLKLPKDSVVGFSAFAIHRNPNYYEQPDVFDPKRFLPENADNVNQYCFVPFGLGPRNCIGNRFALLETKLVLAKTVQKFRFVKSKSTKVPLTFPKGFNLATMKYIFAAVEKRIENVTI